MRRPVQDCSNYIQYNPLINYIITAFIGLSHVCSAHAYICEAISWVHIATQLAYNMSYYHCPHLQTKTASYNAFRELQYSRQYVMYSVADLIYR